MTERKRNIIPGFIITTLFFIISFLMVMPKVHSQFFIVGSRSFFSNWRMDVNLGPTLFFGDLTYTQSPVYLKDLRMAYGIKLDKQVSPAFSFGLQFLAGRLHGTRLNFGGKNLLFENNFMEYNLNTTVDLFNFFGASRPDRKFSLYGIAGIGVLQWKSNVKDYNTGSLLAPPVVNENPAQGTQSALIVPLGMGMRFQFNHKFGMNLEGTMRTANSDYLDDWKAGFKYDMFSYTSMGLFYNFNAAGDGRDPEKIRQRYEKRAAKDAQKEWAYKEQPSSDFQNDDFRYQKFREAQAFKEERKKYSEANNDLRYYNKKIKSQDSYNYTPEYYQETASLGRFSSTYNRTELPQVVEYDITGVYNRVTSEQNKEIIPVEVNKTTTQPPSIVKTANNGFKADEIDILPPNASSGQSKSRVFTENGMSIQDASMEHTGILFKVQILAKTTGPADISQLAKNFGIVESIDEETNQGTYRYVTGAFKTYDEAATYANIVRDRGISGAFIVAYKNGIRVPMAAVTN